MMHFMTNVDDFDVISTIYGRFWAGFGLNFYGARFLQVPPAQRAGAEGMPHKPRRVSHHSGASKFEGIIWAFQLLTNKLFEVTAKLFETVA